MSDCIWNTPWAYALFLLSVGLITTVFALLCYRKPGYKFPEFEVTRYGFRYLSNGLTKGGAEWLLIAKFFVYSGLAIAAYYLMQIVAYHEYSWGVLGLVLLGQLLISPLVALYAALVHRKTGYSLTDVYLVGPWRCIAPDLLANPFLTLTGVKLMRLAMLLSMSSVVCLVYFLVISNFVCE